MSTRTLGHPTTDAMKVAVLYAAILLGGLVLGEAFWNLRAAPVGGCAQSPAHAELRSFRAWSVPLHLAAGALVVGALLWLRHDAVSLVFALGYGVLMVAAKLDHQVLVHFGGLQLFMFIFWVPILAAVALVSIGLMVGGRTKEGVGCAQAVGWSALLFALPANFAAVWFAGTPFCLH